MVNPWLPPPTPISLAKFAFVGKSESSYTCPWVSIGNPPMPGDLVDKNPKVHGLQGALFALHHGP